MSIRGLLLTGSMLSSIQASADGTVTNNEGVFTAAGGLVTRDAAIASVGAKEAMPDPNAPAPTEGEIDPATGKPKEATAAPKEGEGEAATAEEDTWETRDKTKDVPLAPEESAEIDARTDLNDAQKVAMKDATIEMKTTGDLSPASIKRAAAAWGVSEAMVKQYVDAIKPNYASAKAAPTKVEGKPEGLTPEQQTQFTARMDALYKDYGGKAGWDAFSQWAIGAGGLTEAEQAELTAAIDASPRLGVLAAKEFVARFNAQGGAAGGPKDISRGANSPNPQPQPLVKPFANKSEQQAALRATDSMGRNKMDADPQHRAEVERRMAVSNFSVGGTGKSAFM